jgi:hypothetical protein
VIGHVVLPRRGASHRRRYERAAAQAHAEQAIYHRLWCKVGEGGKRLTYGPFSKEAVTPLGLNLSAFGQAGDDAHEDETVNGTALVARSANTPNVTNGEMVRH